MGWHFFQQKDTSLIYISSFSIMIKLNLCYTYEILAVRKVGMWEVELSQRKLKDRMDPCIENTKTLWCFDSYGDSRQIPPSRLNFHVTNRLKKHKWTLSKLKMGSKRKKSDDRSETYVAVYV